jgi:hypothetical protein
MYGLMRMIGHWEFENQTGHTDYRYFMYGTETHNIYSKTNFRGWIHVYIE